MADTLFLYKIELPLLENPRGTHERLSEELRAFIVSHGWQYGMGALGGSFRIYGTIHGRGGTITEGDRQALGAWIAAQRVRCIARLGAIEPDREDTNYFRPITEWVFEVDNLTEADRAEVAEQQAKVRRWKEEVEKKASGSS